MAKSYNTIYKVGEILPLCQIMACTCFYEGDETLVNKLAAIAKGNLATVSGRLSYEVYNDKGSLGIIASKFGDFEDGTGEASGEEAEAAFEEPNFG